jgi:hypothetical protein
MKSKYNSAATFFLILTLIFAVLIGTATAQPGGHLLVLRSANFGWNLGFNLEIDGRPAGNYAQGHYFHAWLPAGRHVLTVKKVPRTGLTGPTSTTLNVEPGATYLYTAMWDSDFVYLRPSTVCLTPGALWEMGWPARPNCVGTTANNFTTR